MGCASSNSGSQSSAFEAGAPRPKKEISDPAVSSEQGKIRSQREFRLAARVQDNSGPVCTLPDEVMKKLERDSEDGASNASASTSNKKLLTPPDTSSRGVGWSSSWNSQLDYAHADQTIIIFDWDDTLCPSTCMRRFSHFDAKGRLAVKIDQETRLELNMLADHVLPLLRSSMSMGKVVIVTNAKRPWVDISRHHFLPSLRAIMKDIPVIYALELVKEQEIEQDGLSHDLLTETKARAMKAAVTEFYSRYPGQSWKNIVSLGDALFEHNAIRQVVEERENVQKKCRCKTLKLLEGPTIAGMIVQLSIIEGWLTKIVQMDDDIDIDLSAEEGTVEKWFSLFGDGR